jgi:hypothetical protein
MPIPKIAITARGLITNLIFETYVKGGKGNIYFG